MNGILEQHRKRAASKPVDINLKFTPDEFEDLKHMIINDSDRWKKSARCFKSDGYEAVINLLNKLEEVIK